MELREELRGARASLMRPVLMGNVFVCLLAVYYATLTLSLPADGLSAFLVLVVLAALLPALLARVRVVRRLSSVERLEAGLGGADDRVAALGELQRLPDAAALMTLQHWLATVALIGLGLWLTLKGSPAQLLRIVLLGGLFGPVAASVVDLLAMRRAGEVMRRVASGLKPSEVVRAMPTTQSRLRLRVVIVTAVLVVLPAVALVDASHQLGLEQLRRVATLGATAESIAHARLVIYGNLALLLLAVAAGAALIGRAGGAVIAEPLRALAEDARKLGRGEQVSARVYPATDEAWGVTADFGVMVDQLNQVLGEVKRTVTRLGSTTDQMIEMSGGSEALAAEQATALNETSATTEELAQSARQIVEQRLERGEVGPAAPWRRRRPARSGPTSSSARSTACATTTAPSPTRCSGSTSACSRSARWSSSSTGWPTGRDLLALSAELEGTKAGDVGRGFTLVAAEMRRLAENVLESTKEIEELIDEIREATDRTVDATERGMQQTVSGTALATQVAGVLDQVVQLAERTSEAVRAISLATQQQQTGTDQLAEAMADILGITQQSLAATKQLSQANDQLVTLAGTLGKLAAEVRFGA